MRQGLTSFKAFTAIHPRNTPNASFREAQRSKGSLATIGRVLAALGAASALSACSIIDKKAEPDVSASARDVNWTFADASAMEAKVASLQEENVRLSRQVMELERDLKTAQEAAAEATTPPSPALKDSPILESPPQTQPAPLPSNPVNAPATPAAEAAAEQVPVEAAPRLLPSNATFTSTEETLFENEAPEEGALNLTSVLWGVHLASYRAQEEAVEGWRQLQRANPDELGLLEPRIERVSIEGRGEFLRLIGGGFASEDKARTLCRTLEQKGLYCQVAGFGGERLSLAEPGQG